MYNPNYNIKIISPSPKMNYTPLLAYNSIKNNELDLSTHITDVNPYIEYIKGNVTDINKENNEIIINNKEKLKYDYLILAHGSIINTFNIPGIDKFCLFVNNPSSIYNKLHNLLPNSKIAVIGCGPTGTELIGHLNDLKKFNIIAIDAAKYPLPTYIEKSRINVINNWKQNNIKMYFDSPVRSITKDYINLKDNKIDYDMAIWAGGIKANSLTEKINKKYNLDCLYGIPVNKYLKVFENSKIYAIGDCAYSKNSPTAQVAYQQGKYLAQVFNSSFVYNKSFKYSDFGKICYIGNKNSIYEYENQSVSGYPIFIWNQFIHTYNSINLKQMFDFIFK